MIACFVENTDFGIFSPVSLQSLLDNLLRYNYLSEFEGDTIIDNNGNSHIIYKSFILLDEGRFVNGDLLKYRDCFLTPLTLYVAEFVGSRDDQSKPKLDHSDYTIVLTSDDSGSSHQKIHLRVDLIHHKTSEIYQQQANDTYPEIIDSKYMIHQNQKKEVERIYAYNCQLMDVHENAVKPMPCKHKIQIFFKGRTSTGYWDGHKLSVEELAQKGYLPFIKNDIEDHRFCELSKMFNPTKYVSRKNASNR